MSKKSAGEARISGAEWTVMRVVWARGSATARDVADAVSSETGWAYTTVKTLLTRLVEKGAVRESRRGNQSVYEPLLREDAARHSAVRSLVDRAFDGLVPMVRFLVEHDELSAEDRRRIRRILDEHDREGKR